MSEPLKSVLQYHNTLGWMLSFAWAAKHIASNEDLTYKVAYNNHKAMAIMAIDLMEQAEDWEKRNGKDQIARKTLEAVLGEKVTT